MFLPARRWRERRRRNPQSLLTQPTEWNDPQKTAFQTDVQAFINNPPASFDPTTPERFLARCARTINPLTPGTCLHTRRIGEADLTVRFPREWLANWRDVEGGLDSLIAQLKPAGGSSASQ